MKPRLITILLVMALLTIPAVAFASNITNAKWYGIVNVTNNSTATANVSVTANISTANLIAGNYLNAGANNTAMRNSTGADVPFMPGYTDANLWSIFVASIGNNNILPYVFYTDNTTGGEIRYFPGATGMLTSDDATMEPGDNFTIETSGWFDTTYSANRTILDKQGAARIFIGSTGNITAILTNTSEDLSTYTEVDVNNKLTVTATTATGADVDRDEDVYLYKDKTADYFDDLEIDFDIYMASTSLDASIAGMAISNTIDDAAGFAATDLSVLFLRSGAAYDIKLYRGPLTASDTYNAAADTEYYCTLSRTAGNDVVTLYIYSDTERTVLLDTLTQAGFGTETWQYVFGFVNVNTVAAGQDFDGYVTNLRIFPRVEVSAGGIASGEYTLRTTIGFY